MDMDTWGLLEEDAVRRTERVGAWSVTLLYGSDDADLGGPVGIQITPVDTNDAEAWEKGITSTLLREIPLTEISRKVRAEQVDERSAGGSLPSLATLALAARQQKGLTPVYLSALAAMYQHYTQVAPKKAVDAVAHALDRPVNTVKMHVVRARRDGYLEGHPGTSVTVKARDVINTEIQSEALWALRK